MNIILLMIVSFIGIKWEYLRMNKQVYWYHFFNTVLLVSFLTFFTIVGLNNSELLESMWIWSFILGFMLLIFVIIYMMEFPRMNTMDFTPIVIIFIWGGYALSYIDQDSWKLVLYTVYVMAIIGTIIEAMKMSMPTFDLCGSKKQSTHGSVLNSQV